MPPGIQSFDEQYPAGCSWIALVVFNQQDGLKQSRQFLEVDMEGEATYLTGY